MTTEEILAKPEYMNMKEDIIHIGKILLHVFRAAPKSNPRVFIIAAIKQMSGPLQIIGSRFRILGQLCAELSEADDIDNFLK